jgi:hypothetical protein
MINEKDIHTTPVGVANYPYIFVADNQFEKPDGVYSVKLTLSDEDAKPFVKIYEETLLARQQKENTDKRAPHNQYKVLKNGGIEFKFKLKAKVTMRDGTDFEQRPKILNSDKTVAEQQPVFSGSKMKIAFQAVSWANNLQGVGVALRLKAVQLIDVVSEKPKGNGDNSSSDYDYGFSKEKVSNVPSGKKEVPVSQEADF